MKRMWRYIQLLLLLIIATSSNSENVDKLNETTSDDVDGESSRKILGSSVVTSVSVIMDTENGTKIFTDAVGRPISKPLHGTDVASPIELLNPDRYEFYTFDDNGDLIKRLMTWEEIKEIVASGSDDDTLSLDSLTSNGILTSEKRVDDVVNNVQNVVQEEIENQKNLTMQNKPQLDTPDVSDSWSQILPAIFENSGEEISPKPTPAHATPDTIMVEPPMMEVKTLPPSTTTITTTVPSTTKVLTSTVTTTKPTTTTRQTTLFFPNLELTKENSRPIYHIPENEKNTRRPTIQTTTVSSTTPTTTTTTVATTTTTTPATTTTTTTAATQTTERIVESTTIKRSSPTTTTVPTTPFKPPFTTVKISTSTETMLPETTIAQQSSTTKTPQETTIQDLTTEPPLSISTLLEILRQSTTVPEITTEKLDGLSTFFIITDDTRRSTTTEISQEATTNVPETTKFSNVKNEESNEVTQNLETSTNLDDLSTLATEYLSTKFDKFLLTSTNIYEINSELSSGNSIKYTTVPPTTTNEQEITTIDESDTIKISTTEVPMTTTSPVLLTTENNIVESIEQLISQAMATEVAPQPTPIENEDINKKIQEMITNSSNKTMEIVQNETATMSSNLISDNFNPETTTEIGTTTTEIPPPIDSVLGESFGSILSQVWGSTVEPLMESTTEITTTEHVPHIINITIISNENVKNQTKPAKADLSLEMAYDKMAEELKKNSTLLPLESVPEQAKIVYISTTENIDSTTDIVDSTTTLETITESTTQNDKIAEPIVVVEINESNSNETEEINDERSTSTWTLVSTILPPVSKMTTTLPVSKTTTTLSSVSKTTTTLPPPMTLQSVKESTTVRPVSINLVHEPLQGFGLEDSTKQLDGDVYEFVQLCNELAFGFWKTATGTLSPFRSVVLSPFAATSLLAMVFLGARGATSGEMNEILKLDDVITFNPHLIFKNISESIRTNNNTVEGVAISSIIRQLYSDRSKGKLLSFYKDRVRQFYDGHVEEVGFREISDIVRRRTNLLVKKASNGTISEFIKDNYIYARPPLAGISTSIFQTDCSSASTSNSDGELYFTVSPTLRQRRLIPIPAAVWRGNFLAGYEASLDATAAALGTKYETISTIFVMPGKPGLSTPMADGLTMLEKHFIESSFKKGAWARLLRSLIPRNDLELQLPRFIHRSVLNATSSFQKMGLHELFDAKKADLRGLNGALHELHLSEMVQINEFGLCSDNGLGATHHREVYPAAVGRRSRLGEHFDNIEDYQQFDDTLHDPSIEDLPLPLRPRQARFPKESDNNQVPRLRFDRPFLYFVRHNPSGIILHMGRFLPRLLS